MPADQQIGRMTTRKSLRAVITEYTCIHWLQASVWHSMLSRNLALACRRTRGLAIHRPIMTSDTTRYMRALRLDRAGSRAFAGQGRAASAARAQTDACAYRCGGNLHVAYHAGCGRPLGRRDAPRLVSRRRAPSVWCRRGRCPAVAGQIGGVPRHAHCTAARSAVVSGAVLRGGTGAAACIDWGKRVRLGEWPDALVASLEALR
jgi:hypothetical protein